MSDLELHSLVGGLQSGDYNLKRETTVWFLEQRILDPEMHLPVLKKKYRGPFLANLMFNKQVGSNVTTDG